MSIDKSLEKGKISAKKEVPRKMENMGEALRRGENIEVPENEQEDVRELTQELAEAVLVEEAAVERLMKSREKAALYERLRSGETIEKSESEVLAADLQNQGWTKIFSELQDKDQVAFFNAPGGELSIKKMNDVYFGPQVTDEILGARNKTLRDLMKDAGAVDLKTDYKSGVFKLSPEAAGKLEKVGAKLDQEMSKIILKKIEQKIKEMEENSEYSQEEAAARASGLQSLQQKVEQFGFVMGYGVSEVQGDMSGSDKSPALLAVAEAAQAAQLSRRSNNENKYGQNYNEGMLEQEIEDVFGKNSLAARLDKEVNSLKDAEGNLYQIFSREDDKYALNRDLARLVRKDKFIPLTEKDKNGLKLVAEYMRRINLIDLIKPNTAEEISGKNNLLNGEKLSDDISRREVLVDKLLVNDLNQDELKEVGQKLSADQKDSRFSSWETFHFEAVKKDNCAYVSLDVLDLGVDLLLSYESAMQDMAGKDAASREKLILAAGDTTTEKMRQVRGQVKELYEKYFDQEPLILVGGDEVTIATEETPGLEDFMLELQKVTNSRVVKTTVAGAVRHSEEGIDWDDKDEIKERLTEHLAAEKKVEIGTGIAKEVEETRRHLKEKFMRENGDVNEVGKILAESGLDNFIIREKYDGGFEAVFKGNKEKRVVSAGEAKSILEKIVSEYQAKSA